MSGATSPPETWRTRLARWGFNLFPAYWGTGAHIEYIAGDYSEIRVALPLSWRTRNYVGTIFGGSMYGAMDPIYMVMLIKRLGSEYVVWDRAASIRFRRPGRSTLRARCAITRRELDEIRDALRVAPKIDRVFTAALVSDDGTVHATVEKTIHIARRDPSPRAPTPSFENGDVARGRCGGPRPPVIGPSLRP